MTAEQSFSVANMFALLTWVALVVAPRRPAIVTIAAGVVVPAMLAIAYTLLIVFWWSGSNGGFSSLAGVAALFDNEWLLLAGWIHYLAFDLLVGRWEVLDSQRRGIPHLLVLPCLATTFLVGPAGWLLYLAVRTVWQPTSGRARTAGTE